MVKGKKKQTKKLNFKQFLEIVKTELREAPWLSLGIIIISILMMVFAIWFVWLGTETTLKMIGVDYINWPLLLLVTIIFFFVSYYLFITINYSPQREHPIIKKFLKR